MIARKLALIAALVVMSCAACTASARQKTIQTTLASTDVARAAFVAFDAQHQQTIVASAPDKATGEKQLAAYRATQAKILVAFAVTYRAIAAASLVSDQPTLDGMIQAAIVLAGALRDLGVRL